MNILKKGQCPYKKLANIKSPVLAEVNVDKDQTKLYLFYPNGRLEEALFWDDLDTRFVGWSESRFSIAMYEKLLNFFNFSDRSKLERTIEKMREYIERHDGKIVGIYKM